MANTGFKQATIAYRVSQPSGAPVDRNGVLTSISGRKQAIVILVGGTNPAPDIYEVVGYFSEGATVDGNPTLQYNISQCPIGNISVTPSYIFLTAAAPSAVISLSSSGPWRIMSGPFTLATFSQTFGGAGITNITLTRTATEGQGDFTITNWSNGATATLHVVNVNVSEWILTTGFWKNLGIWTNTGVWNY